MNTFTTQIKIDKSPLILQGIEDFLGKYVKITITEVLPEKKKKKKEKSWKLIIPSFTCGGKVSDFYREELYGDRL